VHLIMPYSPNVGELEFCELRIAPVQRLWASLSEVGCIRVLSNSPQLMQEFILDSLMSTIVRQCDSR
jgi:hypothetical protein